MQRLGTRTVFNTYSSCSGQDTQNLKTSCIRSAVSTYTVFIHCVKKSNNRSLQRYKISKGKGKAIALQAWTLPQGSRRLRLPYFKTVRSGRLYPPGIIPGTRFVRTLVPELIAQLRSGLANYYSHYWNSDITLP
jgi:hypothetical protein